VWLIGAMVCLLGAPWVQLFVSVGNGWPHNALQHHWLMLIRCHFRDCKALLVTSLTHVSGAIASVQTFTFRPNAQKYTCANLLHLYCFRLPCGSGQRGGTAYQCIIISAEMCGCENERLDDRQVQRCSATECWRTLCGHSKQSVTALRH